MGDYTAVECGAAVRYCLRDSIGLCEFRRQAAGPLQNRSSGKHRNRYRTMGQ